MNMEPLIRHKTCLKSRNTSKFVQENMNFPNSSVAVNSSPLVSSLTCPLPVSDPPRLPVHLPGLLQTVPHRHQNPSAQGVGDHQAPALEQQAPRGQPGQKLSAGLQRPSCHQWRKSCYSLSLSWSGCSLRTCRVPPSHGLWKDLPDTAFVWFTRRLTPRQSPRETSTAAPQTQAGK